jgi:hypothetical protein
VKADTFTLEQVFGLTTRYVVPLYQRPYVWELEKQWEPLWEDVRTVAERLIDATMDNDDVPHFMGAIVLAQTWSPIDKSCEAGHRRPAASHDGPAAHGCSPRCRRRSR